MCCDYQYQDDYDGYGDFNDDPGTSGEHKPASRKRASEDVDACTDNSYVQPHKEVSRDTIARWIRTVMCAAGVDTTFFKAHSVRAASVSKAKGNFVPVDDILTKVHVALNLMPTRNGDSGLLDYHVDFEGFWVKIGVV
uniref:Uncharacterized protein n=1 Tax=Magallana gigas TaxID=29159 RepID=A0A8W8NGD0_MAGGI